MSTMTDETNIPTGRKIWLVLCLQAGLLAVIGATFWHQEWQYLQPTPRPAGLVQPPAGTSLPVPPVLAVAAPSAAGKPVLFHFFDPDCPCSRFNIAHVRDLQAAFGRDIRFVAVLHGSDDQQLVAQFRRLDLNMEAICDASGALANTLGVYSTPQAVLLDGESRLFYRGNYNVSRYCSDRDTEFARIALDCLLASRPLPAFPTLATTAYGCKLPAARKTIR